MSMITHHPDENLLTEFSAGSLDWALGLAVSAHIHDCTICKSKVSNMNGIGGHLLETCPKQALRPGALNRLFERMQLQEDEHLTFDVDKVDSHTGEKCSNQGSTKRNPRKTGAQRSDIDRQNNEEFMGLPPMIQRAAKDYRALKWRTVSTGLKSARLEIGQNKYEVAFHKIKQGCKVVEHDHKGLEVTLVLSGSFSDEGGVYAKGDFLVREPGQVHRPTATQNGDCLCLSVCAAPVAVTGALGKLINPFLRIKPA